MPEWKDRATPSKGLTWPGYIGPKDTLCMMWLELMPVVSALNCTTGRELSVQLLDKVVPLTQIRVSALMLHALTCF